MLSVVLTGDDPPSEFRIFRAGKNETTKGTFLFDAEAAKLVMADFRAHGIDLMIDYDHASLGVGVDPAMSGKAAGWFEPEVRNGELWATNVRWTPSAAEALRQKEWRFMSPAFSLKDGRITSLMNVALTNLPATRQLEPLMAANEKGTLMAASDSGLSPKLVSAALEAVATKDAKTSLDLLKQILAALLGSSAPDDGGDGSSGAPAAPSGDSTPPSTDDTTSTSDKNPNIAAGRLAMALTGKSNAGEAMFELAKAYKLAPKLEEQLAADKAKVELDARKANVIKLQQLGAETPATSGLAEGKLCKRLLEEPLDEQNQRVAALLAARGGKLPEVPKTPPGDANESGVEGLSAQELTMCKQMGCEPAMYLLLKKQRDGATTAKAGV